MNSSILTSLLLPHLSSSLTDSLPSLNLLCPLKDWCSIHARCLQSSLKHSIRFCGIVSKFQQNSIPYRSSNVSSRPDYIFEVHQQWQSGFSRVYSNCCCRCSFESEMIKIGQSSHNMYSIVNFQWSTTILNICTKMSGNFLKAPRDFNTSMIHYSSNWIMAICSNLKNKSISKPLWSLIIIELGLWYSY